MDPIDDDPFDLDIWAESNEIEMEDRKEEMCDHVDQREVVSTQEMRGATALGLGGQFGTSEVLIVCTECGKARTADRVDVGR